MLNESISRWAQLNLENVNEIQVSIDKKKLPGADPHNIETFAKKKTGVYRQGAE